MVRLAWINHHGGIGLRLDGANGRRTGSTKSDCRWFCNPTLPTSSMETLTRTIPSVLVVASYIGTAAHWCAGGMPFSSMSTRGIPKIIK